MNAYLFPDLINIAFCLKLHSASSAVTAYITTTITNQNQSAREEETRKKWDTGDFHPTNKHGLHVCVPPKLRGWGPNSKDHGIWRWTLWQRIRFRWNHEGGTHRMRLMPLWEEEEREEKHRDKIRWGHKRKAAICKPRGLPSHRVCWYFDLGLPSSRTLRIKHHLPKPSNPWHFVIAAQAD